VVVTQQVFQQLNLYYEFYSDGQLQDESMLEIVKNAVDSAATIRAYLDVTFAEGVCTLTNYVSGKE